MSAPGPAKQEREEIRMKTSLVVATVFFIIGATPLIAQPLPYGPGNSTDSLDYFPMSVGNNWTYVSAYLDTTHKVQCSIDDTARIAGRLYYLHSGPALDGIGIMPLPVDTIRSDSLFRVWRYENGHDYMFFDYYNGNYPSYTTYPEVDTTKVTTNVEITVPAGHFTNCVDIYFPRSFGDESIGFVFAPGVGIVRWYGPFYAPTELLRAVVNGKLISSVDKPAAGIPSEFRLEQNYPNPFNPSTVIGYTVAGVRGQGQGVSNVRLAVYDILGREIAVLVNERKTPGRYEVEFDASGLASGVYIYRLISGAYVESRKMVVMR
jgi:hypothetical protein